MKRSAIFFIHAASVATLIALLSITARQCYCVSDKSVVIDTIYHHDTIYYRVPIPVDSVVIRYIKVKAPIVTANNEPEDTTVTNDNKDSVIVSLPIMQKEYKNKQYHAWVSGYKPSLDSIYIFQESKHIRIPDIQKIRQKKWSFGIQVGAGYGTGGFSPYIGFGIQRNIFSW